MAATTQIEMLLKARILLERSTRWLLRNRRRPLDTAETVARYAEGASACADRMAALLDPEELAIAQAHAERLASAGVPQPLAERVAFVEALVPTLDVAEIAASSGLEVTSVAEVYFALGARLELHWLRDRIIALSRETRWEAMARAALRDDVYAEQAALTAEVVRGGSDGVGARERIDAWSSRNARRGRALPARARRHQGRRRRRRPRAAVGRGPRDPEPDAVEQHLRAGGRADRDPGVTKVTPSGATDGTPAAGGTQRPFRYCSYFRTKP